ncbi:hypothetical protein LWF01_11470 [Saxibacter everestensis]|uniref:PASTA domain-containing protein n=1 Tax=Saxibacter everestensis TaxID=2909229 RepID=A0ABY8QRH1_9MICO|nr:hypothetical protein LWF01_11470 [Brevibacteriaceae bacterium ZFBP1038]
MTDDFSRRVTVPDLIGERVRDAEEMCRLSRLSLYAADEDGTPTGQVQWPGEFVVRYQSLQPGSKAHPNDIITIYASPGGGGGAGDREPRTPPPDPLVAQRNYPYRQDVPPVVPEEQHEKVGAGDLDPV